MNRKLMLVLSLLILIIVVPTVAVSQSTDNYIADLIKNGNKQPGNDKVVMVINGNDVTKAQYLVSVEVQKKNVEKMKEIKNQVVDAPDTDNKEKFLKQIDKKIKMGPDKMAAAKLLYDNMIISEATKKGLLVSIEEAKVYANNIRVNYDQNDTSVDGQQLKEFISTIGEDYYWNEYAPQRYQIGLSATNLKQTIITGSNPKENQQQWYDYLCNLANEANLVFKDDLGVTKAELIDYIKNYNE